MRATLNNVLREIQDCFASLDGDEFSIHISYYPRNAIGFIGALAKQFRPGEALRVYAVGGDGILFDCLNGIVGLPNVELAAVPYGTSNDWVRAFGDNKKALFRNIKLQVSSPSILTDIIHCGNNYALNFCTIGIESDTIMKGITMYNSIPGDIRKFKKLDTFIYNLIIYIAGAKAVFNKKVLSQYYTISIDGEDFSGVFGSINIANGPCYGGNKNAAITAMPNDGILDVLFFRCSNSLKAAGLVIPYTKGGFRRFPNNFTLKRIKKIEIHSEEPLLVDLDGEAFFDTSITVRIIPDAVRIVAPGGISYAKMADSHG